MQPLVIEFVGLPGAGKTSIAQIAIEKLSSSGYRCFALSTLDNPEGLEKKKGGISSKLKMFYHFALSCVTYRQFAISALLYAMHVKPFNLVVLQRFFVMLVRFKFIKTVMNDEYDFIILDQGLIQNIWSIAVSGEQLSNNEYLDRVLKRIVDEISLLIIMVDVEAKLAVERITNRSTMRSRFDRMSPFKAETILSKHKDIFAQIIISAEKMREKGFLNINGSKPIKENVSLIVPFIEQARQAYSA